MADQLKYVYPIGIFLGLFWPYLSSKASQGYCLAIGGVNKIISEHFDQALVSTQISYLSGIMEFKRPVSGLKHVS